MRFTKLNTKAQVRAITEYLAGWEETHEGHKVLQCTLLDRYSFWVIEGCTDPEWDFNNTDNWNNRVLLLEQIETYIKEI